MTIKIILSQGCAEKKAAFRFRVTGETFVDTGPKAPLAAETEVEETRAAPYRCQQSPL